MKLLKTSIILSLVFLVIGCANLSELELLQTKVNLLEQQTKNLSVDIAASKTKADEAVLKTSNAESLANRMAQYMQETSAKLDVNIDCVPRNRNAKFTGCPRPHCRILNPTPNCLYPTRACIDKAIASYQVKCGLL